MKYSSRHNIIVLLAMSLLFFGDTENVLLETGRFEWKQLVLPTLDEMMGV